MNIGEKIKKLRLEKMMTQAELSGDQVTRNMLSLIEKGKAIPSLQTLNYLASRLKVSTAFLLANEHEERMLVKYSKIADIRLAYKNKNYRICMDLCKRLGRNSEIKDDEIKLIMAECALNIAKDEIYSDRIRMAWLYIDEAVMYATETTYMADHIIACAGIMFDYLGALSPSLVPENMDMDSFLWEEAKVLGKNDALCRYFIALKELDSAFKLDSEAQSMHVESRKLIESGEYDKAYNVLNDALKLDEILPGVLLYNIFADLEECCRQLGNQKNTRLYTDQKVTQLERILS